MIMKVSLLFSVTGRTDAASLIFLIAWKLIMTTSNASSHSTSSVSNGHSIRVAPVDNSRLVYQVSDSELSAFIQQYANSVLVAGAAKSLEKDDLARQTRIDIQRSNCFITSGGRIEWGLPHRDPDLMLQLGYDTCFVDTALSKVDAYDVFDSLQACLKKAKIQPKLTDYVLHALNQEVLFKIDQFYSHYRASMLMRSTQKNEDFFQQRLQFVRQLELSSSNQLTLTMHAFIRSKQSLSRVAESTYTIDNDTCNEVTVKCISHRMCDADGLFDCPRSRLDALLSLVKHSDHLDNTSLKQVVVLIDKLNQQATLIQKRVTSGNLYRGDERKLKALGDVVNHAAHYAVRLAGGYHHSSLRDSRRLLKNTLVRNAAVLNQHRSHLWRLWNSLCQLMNPWSKSDALNVGSSASTAPRFFKPATTESFSLVQSCLVVCKG